MEDVLIKTLNQNIGIVVTQHPANSFLNKERVKYFHKNYSNFIFIEKQKIYSCVSQMIIPYVDAVITVSTSIGYYALLWNKKLISLGKNYLNDISDSQTLENLNDVLKKPTIDRYRFLYWLIKYYFIPEKYIKNKNWIEKFLRHGIENHKNGQDIDFYQEIDTKLENITDIFFENKYLSLSNNLVKEYIQVFEDTGNGYREEESYKIFETFSEYSISLNLKMSQGVKSLRIDPLEDSCLIIIENKNMEMIHNGREICKSMYYFEHKDPQLIFFNKINTEQELKIKYKIWFKKNDILKISESKIKKLLCDIEELNIKTVELDKKLLKKDEELKELDGVLRKKDEELKELHSEISLLTSKLTEILNSKGYKLLTFIRKILRKICYKYYSKN